MNVSIIEFIVYGLIAYTGMIVLIISVLKEPPSSRSLAFLRSVFLIPSIIASGILSFSGVNIYWLTTATSNTIKSLNTTQTWTESTTQTNTLVLQNPIWITFHFLLFIVMIIYVITQILSLLTKHDKEDSLDSN